MWDVRVCVACLATGVRMYSMSTNSLLQPYQLLAGIQFGGLPDYLPQKLCWECAALVNKFNLFRRKCERAYLLLQDIYNQHDEILEEHVDNEINRDQRLLSSPLSIAPLPSYTVNDRNAVQRLPLSPFSVTLTPSYAVNSQNVATMKDTSIEHQTYSVKPEVDIVKLEFSCPKSEPGFKSEPFVNDDIVENLEDDDGDEGVENDMKEVIEPEGDFQLELNVTKEEAPPRPCSSGKKETIPPDAWTRIIFTQEQVNELYKQKKNSKQFEKAKLKCELCYQIFKQKYYYTTHMLKHDPSAGSYECDFCKMRYKTRKVIWRHMKVHIINYKCNICGAKKHSRALAKSHYLQHKKLEAYLKLRQGAQDKREAAALKTRASESKRKVKKTCKKKQIKTKMMEYEVVQSILTQEQMMEVIRERQLVKSYNTAPFKCHLCFKVFLENRTYSQHMTVHDPMRGDFECDICKIRQRTRRRLREHIGSSHLRKYTCKICSNVSYNHGVAKDHYQEQHKRIRYMCHVCAATFREPAMQLHMLAKHPSFVTCNVCGECGASFPSYRGLVGHKQQMHQVATLPEENAPYCEECKVQFASKKAWTKHVLNSDRHKDLQKDIVNGCRQCGETFPTKQMLKKHKREQHPDKQRSRQQVRNPGSRAHSLDHPCALCGERMTSAHQQWGHYRRCHPGEPYPRLLPVNYACNQCSKGFHAKSLLEQHIVMHSGPPPLQCKICPKAFYMQLALKRHLSITHSERRPYQCDSCDMSFKLKTALRRHLSVHTGGRPFPCTQCEKAFASLHWLRLHIRKVHNKEHIPTKPRVRKRKPPV